MIFLKKYVIIYIQNKKKFWTKKKKLLSPKNKIFTAINYQAYDKKGILKILFENFKKICYNIYIKKRKKRNVGFKWLKRQFGDIGSNPIHFNKVQFLDSSGL